MVLGCRCRDDAAGDAVAGVSGGVGLHVVDLLVDHDGGATISENAVWGGWVKRDGVKFEAGLTYVTFSDGDILREIAGVVAHGVLEAVLLVGWVEVRPCGFEIRWIAVRTGVDMDTVFANGKIFEVKLEVNALLAGGEGGSAGVLSGAGFNGDYDGVFGSGCEGWDGGEAKSEGGGD